MMRIRGKETLTLKLSEFLTLKKIPENRPCGAETEEERIKYHYTKQEIEAENQWLKVLRKDMLQSIHDGSFENCKIFILGETNGFLYLMDGQHTGVIYKELIENGFFNENTLDFFCVVYKYNSYEDMKFDLERINKSKSWKKANLARLISMDSDGRKLYEEMASKYYGKVEDSVIKQCLFKQHNGEDLFDKKITLVYEELIGLSLYFQEKCKEHCLNKSDISRLTGTNHCASTIRDLMRIIFRELSNYKKEYYASLKDKGDEEWRKDGTRICQKLINGILGDNALASTNWTAFGAADLFKINHNGEFKKQFVQRYTDKAIRLHKRNVANTSNDDEQVLQIALNYWLKIKG